MITVEVRTDNTLNLRTIRHWRDIDPRWGYDIGANKGHFEFVRPYYINAQGEWCGQWDINGNHFSVPHETLQNIYNLQIPDEFNRDDKIRWITGGGASEWGSIIRALDGLKWDVTNSAQVVGAYWCGDVVNVLETKNIKTKDYGIINMSRVQTFKNSDWNLPDLHARPWLVQKVYTVYPDNSSGERPKGIVYMPVVNLDLEFRGGFVPTEVLLPSEWLV